MRQTETSAYDDPMRWIDDRSCPAMVAGERVEVHPIPDPSGASSAAQPKAATP